MKVLLEHARVVLLHGDSKDLGQILGENTVDAIVTDPPSGIAFMGATWDKDKGGRDKWIAWLAATLMPSFLALKPGGHGLIWALPRTSHWTALALELVGFEIRDRVSALFGSGFPKSLTSKSAEIPEWSGTALKPAVEDWWLVRKPLEGTVAQNYAKWGTGVLDIDGCRVEHVSEEDRASATPQGATTSTARAGIPDVTEWSPGKRTGFARPDTSKGRWPAHLVMGDEEAAAMLDEQSGTLKSGTLKSSYKIADRIDQLAKGNEVGRTFPDQAASKGGASRFFYCAKPAKSETELGLDHLPVRSGGEATGREDGTDGLKSPRAGAGRGGGRRNIHPTKKATTLMEYLCRLVTPAGGIVLDPFAGSGTTGVAALAEGFSFIGCEQGGEDDEYIPILMGRINHALEGAELAAAQENSANTGIPDSVPPFTPG